MGKSTRPANVHFYRVHLPCCGFNHPVGNYFNAVEKVDYSEYKP